MDGPMFREALRAAGPALLVCFLLIAQAAAGTDAVEADVASLGAQNSFPPRADRPGDELWYISTRGLPCPSRSWGIAPRVGRYHYSEGWQASDFETLLHSPAELTVIYVHGNRFTHYDAVQRGWHAYQSLIRTQPSPLRFIIWSWPSEAIPHKPLRDVRIKANRAETEGIYLARYLNQIPEQKPTSLIGYSYGARVIGAALHVLGGGTIDGGGLGAEISPTDHWLRAALFAPAIDRDAFAPGNVFQNAGGVVQEPLILFNPCDPVLKRYRLVERHGREQAMGYLGIASNGGITVSQINVGPYIGRTHDESRYLNSSGIMAAVREYVLWETVAE